MAAPGEAGHDSGRDRRANPVLTERHAAGERAANQFAEGAELMTGNAAKVRRAAEGKIAN